MASASEKGCKKKVWGPDTTRGELAAIWRPSHRFDASSIAHPEDKIGLRKP